MQKYIFFCLCSSGIAISQQQTCISNLPPFVVPEEGGRGTLLPVGIQGLVPSYLFTCGGRVTRWGVAMEGGGGNKIEMQVWRRRQQREGVASGDREETFELVGSNSIRPLGGVKLTYLKPDRARQILVKPGDVVGFYLDGNPDPLVDNFQLRLDDVQGGVVEYDPTHSPYGTIHRGTLATNLTNTAPLITVDVGM